MCVVLLFGCFKLFRRYDRLKWDSSAEAPLEVLGVMSVGRGLRQGRIIIIHMTFKEIMVKKLFYVAGQDTGTTEWCDIPITR